VQSAVLVRLSEKEVTFFHESAVALLSTAFPNNWNLSGPQQGHSWRAWETCSKVLPHVSWLIDLSKEHKIRPADPYPFAEVIFRTGAWVTVAPMLRPSLTFFRYLWEREQPILSRSFFEYGLSLGVDHGSLAYILAIRLLGHIALDIAQPTRALEAYTECLEARRKLVDASKPTIANVLDSVACAHVELNNLPEAFAALEESARIQQKDSPEMARTWFIYSMAHLRAGDADKSLEALNKCWKLQNATQDEIEESEYPKHSGDLVLLSRIEAAKGNKELALQLVSKTISLRKDILGSKGPRVADSMYIVAGMLRDEKRDAVAAKLLREIVDMGKGMLEMKPQVSRALWTLGRIEEDFGNILEANELKAKAKKVRREIEGRGEMDDDSDAGFAIIVPWLLI
jgi:tetratricopeptide (TPR) repeat protein